MTDNKNTVEQFFEKHYELLYRFLIKLTKDSHISADIVQETYVRATLKCALFNPSRGSVKNWIFRIALNLWHDELRFSKKESQKCVFASEKASSAPDSNLEKREIIEQALSRIDERSREIVLLSAEHKLKDIAEIMGIPEGTVKSRLHSAKKQLAEFITKNGGFYDR